VSEDESNKPKETGEGKSLTPAKFGREKKIKDHALVDKVRMSQRGKVKLRICIGAVGGGNEPRERERERKEKGKMCGQGGYT